MICHRVPAAGTTSLLIRQMAERVIRFSSSGCDHAVRERLQCVKDRVRTFRCGNELAGSGMAGPSIAFLPADPARFRRVRPAVSGQDYRWLSINPRRVANYEDGIMPPFGCGDAHRGFIHLPSPGCSGDQWGHPAITSSRMIRMHSAPVRDQPAGVAATDVRGPQIVLWCQLLIKRFLW